MGAAAAIWGYPIVTLLPFQRGDEVCWRGEVGRVLEVRGDLVVVETLDGVLHLTTDGALRAMQPVRAG